MKVYIGAVINLDLLHNASIAFVSLILVFLILVCIYVFIISPMSCRHRKNIFM